MNEAAKAAAPTTPVPFHAAAAALQAIDQSMKDAQRSAARTPVTAGADAGPHPALAALLMLREIREELASWESGLIETAREAGASWAELAPPLGVASRQAAERRYLRLRPGAADTTGEQRVQAVRDQRAADRTVSAWAGENIAPLRQLAGQIIGLTDLAADSDDQIKTLTAALGEDGAAQLVEALTATHQALRPDHPALAERVDELREQTRRLRSGSDDKRRA
ncbi:HSP18 transcriptional regulator [Streptomyces sp. NPDC051582]|uniref:HSP18 transcriptional regulator n=1 Tax=Streptomyces sp. NPDC051582 TaxID=3155167 RepID=UPI0034386B8F